jgi:integrase
VAHYETLWRRHVVERIGALAMRDITPRVASGLKQQMLSAGTGIETTRRTMTLLQGLFRLAIEWEEATTNPFAVVRKPPIKPPAPVRPLAVEAVERLRAYFFAAEEWESLLACVLMAYAGLRPSEVAALRVDDVRERTLLVHRAVRLGDHAGLKNGSPYRTVELLQPVKDDIALVAAALGFSPDASNTPLVPNGAGDVRDEDDCRVGRSLESIGASVHADDAGWKERSKPERVDDRDSQVACGRVFGEADPCSDGDRECDPGLDLGEHRASFRWLLVDCGEVHHERQFACDDFADP